MTTASSSLGFAVGDTLLLRRTFSSADFAAFSRLSGDANVLHHDSAYAASTPFGRPVLPVHLSAMPISAVAGMAFPGRRALILANSLKATVRVVAQRKTLNWKPTQGFTPNTP